MLNPAGKTCNCKLLLPAVKYKESDFAYCQIMLVSVWHHYLRTCRWRAPEHILQMPETRHQRVRKRLHILTEGDDIPPPIKTFKVFCIYFYLYLGKIFRTLCKSLH